MVLRSFQSFGSIERGSPTWKNRAEQRKKQVRANPKRPFRLLTEQRGEMKVQQSMKNLQQRMNEEGKRRIPIAQGLPSTIHEPQVLPKPPVKDNTKPLNVKLHTESRAVQRAKFDHLMEEKLKYLERQRLEEQRLWKVAEEEEIQRLRKEMVPYAQLMPYFDRPFIPKKSSKTPTTPRAPKFHSNHCHTKCPAHQQVTA